MSPTARSLKVLRDAGFTAEVVEKWIPFAKVRKDLWGWCDIIALDPHTCEVIAVQTTTKSNMAARATKIRESDITPLVRRCRIKIHVHGWYKSGNKWLHKLADLTKP